MAVQPTSDNDFVTLARVFKTQGRHGEVAAALHSDVPDRFRPGLKLSALSADGHRRNLEIETLWPHKGAVVFKFAGISDLSSAEELMGSELQVPLSERAQLDAGWIYVSDLAGCSVLDGEKIVGVVKDLQFGAGEAPLLLVSTQGGDRVPGIHEIPFADAYIQSLDLEHKRIVMRLPEGMLELNAALSPEEKEHQANQDRRSRRRRDQ